MTWGMFWTAYAIVGVVVGVAFCGKDLVRTNPGVPRAIPYISFLFLVPAWPIFAGILASAFLERK